MLVRDLLDFLQKAPQDAVCLLRDAELGDLLVTSLELKADYPHNIPIGRWNPRGLQRQTLQLSHPTVIIDAKGSEDDVKDELTRLGRYAEKLPTAAAPPPPARSEAARREAITNDGLANIRHRKKGQPYRGIAGVHPTPKSVVPPPIEEADPKKVVLRDLVLATLLKFPVDATVTFTFEQVMKAMKPAWKNVRSARAEVTRLVREGSDKITIVGVGEGRYRRIA